MQTGRETLEGEETKRSWAERIMRYYDEMKTLPAWQRMRFVKEVAWRTGWAENTIQRQLAGLLFLEAQGKDLRELRDGVSLMSIEAVAKIMRQDPETGRALLEDVLERRITTRQIADIYKRAYQAEKPAGGYKRGSAALASLYADVGNGVSADRPIISEAPAAEAGVLREQVALRVDAEEGVRPPAEIVVSMSLVARRLAQSLLDQMSGQIEVQFAPEVLEPSSVSGRVHPLLHLKDENGVCASVFVHDGALHRREAAEYAFTSALGRAMLGGDMVFAYVAEPGPDLVAELQDLVGQNETALDVRRERIVVRSAARDLDEPLASIKEIKGLFPEKSASGAV